MTNAPKVTVVDYGMGNIWSVLGALRYLGVEQELVDDPEKVRQAECLILPGVGSFRRAMNRLTESGLGEAICETVVQRQVPILGICLGMQLLGSLGTEDGETAGLGLVPARVDRFTPDELSSLKLPHIGFNAVTSSAESRLFRGLPRQVDFYFVHSYRMLPEGLDAMVSTCTHGVDFVAAFEAGPINGVQFHPEKSQTNGLALLRNFLNLKC